MAGNRVQVEIRGRVQGVGYRAWLARVAEITGVEGWVRNRNDGWVEAVLVAGTRDQLDAVLALVHRGPEGARVEDVATRPATEDDISHSGAPGFSVLPDA